MAMGSVARLKRSRAREIRFQGSYLLITWAKSSWSKINVTITSRRLSYHMSWRTVSGNSCIEAPPPSTDQASFVQRLDNATKTNHAIHWIVIYPVDSIIHFLNNRGQDAIYFPVINSPAVMLLNSDICFQGLFTLSTVIVDYRGYRVIAQSIIPGKYWYLFSLMCDGFLLFPSPILFYHLCQNDTPWLPSLHEIRTCQRI